MRINNGWQELLVCISRWQVTLAREELIRCSSGVVFCLAQQGKAGIFGPYLQAAKETGSYC